MSYCMLMNETIERPRDKFFKWNEAFESKGLKVVLGKTKLMVSSDISKDGMSKSKVDPMLCLLCGKWINGRCAGVFQLQCFHELLLAENMKGILERQWSRKKSYVMKWKLLLNSHTLVTG